MAILHLEIDFDDEDQRLSYLHGSLRNEDPWYQGKALIRIGQLIAVKRVKLFSVDVRAGEPTCCCVGIDHQVGCPEWVLPI